MLAEKGNSQSFVSTSVNTLSLGTWVQTQENEIQPLLSGWTQSSVVHLSASLIDEIIQREQDGPALHRGNGKAMGDGGNPEGAGWASTA